MRDARSWSKILRQYRRSDDARAVFEIAVTLLPFIGLWVLMWLSLSYSYWLTLLLAIPTAAFLVRLFMVQHDCGHGSFFSSRRVNDWVGRIFGILTFTPYAYWRHTHALHHASSGNLDRRGHGDIHTMTVEEYRNSSAFERLRYRLYRHPLVMFGIGPGYLFLIQHRVPSGLMRRGWRPWVSAMGTNLSILLVSAAIVWMIGLEAFLLIQIPVVCLAATFGVWLFFVQHQFEDTLWAKDDGWNWHQAALHGSSHYDLPGVLRWLTANIGMHHIHHLSGGIPFYRLPAVMRDHPELKDVGRLTLWESFRCVRLTLWDEAAQRLVSFRTAAAMGAYSTIR